MIKLISILVLALISHSAFSQKEIKLIDVSQHIGDSISFTGTIVSGRFLSTSKGGPTLMNVGAPYPNQLLTLVVWEVDRKNFQDAPELAYIKKVVKVSGKIELFKDKPQIVLHNDKQITVITDDIAAPSNTTQNIPK
jgi:hypothetical protein